jgi:D-xylose transport system permease protein
VSTISVNPPLPGSESLEPEKSALRKRLKVLRQNGSGLLPIIIGMIILGAYFQFRSSAFLSPGNLNNLIIQSATYMLLGMAEIWLLLLGDIDLAVGWVTAVGAAIAVILLDTQYHSPSWPRHPLVCFRAWSRSC